MGLLGRSAGHRVSVHEKAHVKCCRVSGLFDIAVTFDTYPPRGPVFVLPLSDNRYVDATLPYFLLEKKQALLCLDHTVRPPEVAGHCVKTLLKRTAIKSDRKGFGGVKSRIWPTTRLITR